MNAIDRVIAAFRSVMEQADAPAQCSHCSVGAVESPIDTERLTEAREALAAWDALELEDGA